MADLSSTVAEELANYYEYIGQHLHKWVDPLSQEAFWHNPYPYGIRKQSPVDWSAEYSAEREPEAKNRFAVLLRCAGHAYHHVGQIIFLSKELAREAGSKAASH